MNVEIGAEAAQCIVKKNGLKNHLKQLKTFYFQRNSILQFDDLTSTALGFYNNLWGL
jgi:hypothetical protein